MSLRSSCHPLVVNKPHPHSCCGASLQRQCLDFILFIRSIELSCRSIELLYRFIELLLRYIEIIIAIYRHIIAFYRIIISIYRNNYSDILIYYCVLSK